ncbi:MAG: glycosyltransferase [Vicingaceae bacterium]
MKLSIVIVNYNVKYFLHTCLNSVLAATKGIDAEIIVVDNASVDGSLEMLRSRFSDVDLIANQENVGFSKANNQAIDKAKGKYILLLNPDTVVPEDCFSKCIGFMDDHDEVGGLGVKMVDGAGNFLPESKRALPTPPVAFYKIFGLSRIFPRSRLFGKYHLGFLDDDTINEVEVLSGAFMFLRKSLINQIGGLDESFFMYGEDIDLSYRITQAGFKNIYFPETSVIHFKGESTKKSSVNYVLVFYRAMIIFARKHFENKNARMISALINMAIYLRAGLALFRRGTEKLLLPFSDILLLYGGLELVTRGYEQKVFNQISYYPNEVHFTVIPLFVSIWITTQFFFGGYRQPISMKRVFNGLISGTVLVFATYAMLDESFRFSRAIIALSVLWSFLALPLSRWFLKEVRLIRLQRFSVVNTAVIGSPMSIRETNTLLMKSAEKRKNLFFINPLRKSDMPLEFNEIKYDASLYQLKDVMTVYGLDEIIFCLADLSYAKVISLIQSQSLQGKNFYFQPLDGGFILRSSSIQSVGEFIDSEQSLSMSRWSILKKRVFDIVFSTLFLLSFPFIVVLLRRPGRFLKNMLGILIAEMTFVGSVFLTQDKKPYLLDFLALVDLNFPELVNKRKWHYMVEYSLIQDVEIVFSNLSSIEAEPKTDQSTQNR